MQSGVTCSMRSGSVSSSFPSLAILVCNFFFSQSLTPSLEDVRSVRARDDSSLLFIGFFFYYSVCFMCAIVVR